MAGRVVDELHQRLRELADPARAANERRYLKSSLTHLGVRVPDVRRITRTTRREYPTPSSAELLRLVDELWHRDVHELRLAAVELLQLSGTLLTPAELPHVERLLRGSGTWALVDPLAIRVAGRLVIRYPELAAELDRWSCDDDHWIRRSALLSLLLGIRNGHPDLPRFERYAEAMLAEREFFIRKAIGWVLRELSQDRPDYVRDWVEPRVDRLSGVTLREAVRHLRADDRLRLLAAHRRRP